MYDTMAHVALVNRIDLGLATKQGECRRSISSTGGNRFVDTAQTQAGAESGKNSISI
jgi:hypothetical protein